MSEKKRLHNPKGNQGEQNDSHVVERDVDLIER